MDDKYKFWLNNSIFNFLDRRSSAIDDRAIDVSDVAKELGIKLPVSITASVWTKYVQWMRRDKREAISQEAKDILHDMLSILAVWMKYHDVAQTNLLSENHLYEVFVCHRDNASIGIKLVTLKAVFRKSVYESDLAITIMLPDED
jgi:hypothetical protein